MPTHMDRLTALVSIRNYVDANRQRSEDEEVLPGITMLDLRNIVDPTVAEDVR